MMILAKKVQRSLKTAIQSKTTQYDIESGKVAPEDTTLDRGIGYFGWEQTDAGK